MRSPGRGGHAWRQVSTQIKATHDYCCLCGKPVDKTLRWPNPMSATIEHHIPLNHTKHLPPAQQRTLALDPRLLGLAHLACNSSKQDRPATATTPHTRAW